MTAWSLKITRGDICPQARELINGVGFILITEKKL
jgi:hypothetical protein